MSMDKIDIYTQALNTAFVNSYDAIPEQAPIDDCITEVTSKGRVENYPWLNPPPLFSEWQGNRKYAKLGETNYRVPNVTYSAAFEMPYEDLEDDQIDGFKRQAAAMARGAQNWKRIESIQNLARGQTTPCFDGSNFFAASHNIGTGDNILAGTAGGSDGVTHAMAALVIKEQLVKPLLWQLREAPDFQTDAGSVEARKIRKVKWWSDMRAAAAFGFWWDAVLVKFTNTPTVAEMQTTLGNLNARLLSFQYPKNLNSDPPLYPHEQVEFTDKTLAIVCSGGIAHILRQALTLSLIGATENPYKGFAKQIVSNRLNGVV